MTQERLAAFQDETARSVVTQRALRGPRPSCSACGKPTSERKPVCDEHLDRMPYVREVHAEEAARADEVERVKARGWREVDVRGSRAREIVSLVVVHGGYRRGRLAADVDLSVGVLHLYLIALRSAGLLDVRRTKRTGMKRKHKRFAEIAVPTAAARESVAWAG